MEATVGQYIRCTCSITRVACNVMHGCWALADKVFVALGRGCGVITCMPYWSEALLHNVWPLGRDVEAAAGRGIRCTCSITRVVPHVMHGG